MNVLSVKVQVFPFGNGAILRLALHLNDLVFGQLESRQKREAQRETQSRLSTNNRRRRHRGAVEKDRHSPVRRTCRTSRRKRRDSSPPIGKWPNVCPAEFGKLAM